MILEHYDNHLLINAKPRLKVEIESAIKELLEKKHLYQRLHVNWPDLDKFAREGEAKLKSEGVAQPNDWQEIYDVTRQVAWRLVNPSVQRLPFHVDEPTHTHASIDFSPPTVKMVCQNCEALMPYNFIGGYDNLEDLRDITKQETDQLFILNYQCQGCKLHHETFMVQRNELKLMLTGRMPMEKILVPSFIPKAQSKFFSDAIIAYNSGQVLAANFLLRTFLEQYVRGLSDNPSTQEIESLFGEYKNSLPHDFKERFPSLNTIYDKLSDDIHGATASEDVFNQAKDDIEAHFDAKRVYKITI